MNISYRWLQAVCPGLGLGPVELAERLAMRGAPVEAMRGLAEGLEGIIVGRVESSERHPNADRLSLCRVDTGSGSVDVVCGAPNVTEGKFYPFAPVGATLPGGIRIEKRNVRGVISQGMLCSERELGLGTDHQGILELRGDPVPGQPLATAMGLDDYQLDVEVSPNRPDLLSHVGVARDVAPEGVAAVSLPEIPGAPDLELQLRTNRCEVHEAGATIRIEDPDLCPRYLGAVIRGATVGPSPAWLAGRLRAVGARPINNVVDATNYVMYELGQPLHAFDLALLKESTIVVRRAREGETMRTLDGVDRVLDADMLTICDAEDPVAIAGVMGGEHSEVSGATTDILLECALFDPKSIRQTRRALGMHTDASYRFERGVDPAGMEAAIRRAVEIIVATAGGSAAPHILDVCPRPWEGATVHMRPARVERVLGVLFDRATLHRLLEPLGFELIARSDGTYDATVPGYRSYDVRREVDLIEEVARAYGYDSFPEDLGAFRPGTVPDDPMFQLQDRLRDLLVEMGFLEAQTPAFAPEAEGEVRVQNPVSVEEGFLRRSLLPGLLRRVAFNFARGAGDIRLFENATDCRTAPDGGRAPEEIRLAAAMTGHREPPHWSRTPEPLSVWDLKGVLESVARGAGFDASVEPHATDEAEAFDPALSFRVVTAQGTVVGAGGRLRAGAIDAPAWAGDTWAFEITLPAEPLAPEGLMFREPPSHPGVERDLALIVPRSVPAQRVTREIRSAGGELLTDVEIFDLYEGEAVPAGTRSIAYRLRFRAPDRTLTDEEVRSPMETIQERLKTEMGVVPRGS